MHALAAPNNGAAIVDDRLFRFLVDLEVKKAQRLRYSVSVIYVAVDPIATQEPSEPSLAEVVTPCIRGTDAVGSWAPTSLALLLIDAEPANLSSILRRVTARLGTVGWSAGGSCYPTTATRADEMLHQAMESMIRAKEDGGDRLYVAS